MRISNSTGVLGRSRKLAQTDATTHNHELNLHSLARRISSIHNKTGSLSAACCSQQQPEYQLAGTAATEPRGWKASRAITDLCTWLPGPGAAQLASQTRRPSSAPTGTSGRYRSSSSSSSGSGSSSSSSRQPQTDWQLFKRRAAPVPQPAVQPVQLPQSRFYAPGPSLLPSVQARLYKAAIMQDILQRAVYRAADIRALCQQYVAASPLEHRELLRGVAAEVLRELDVPQ
ncbi:hypothetical protein OEZ85_008879 [Tetradesmus obliquus]|uniref:Uncharacterized protein n=1 Tax=Tetradesmus obliquus TaxID=3088 RepID=A0ABY8TK45_TETOB|nr:hypothetical protein OEZ85_008879 [Tetradesmus obliquus]